MEENKYGILLGPAIKLHRKYFNEMVKLLGITVLYQAPKTDKHYTLHTEVKSSYEDMIPVGCIFEEHPDQHTMKKLGWVSELQEAASLIHVPYDLPGIQKGALFIVPSGIDNTKGRVFRVVDMLVGMVYPASITCKLVPEYSNTFEPNSQNFAHSDFNLLNDEEPE